MYDVILFGGTDEGHKIADFLREKSISHIVCVATEYGAEMIGNKNVRVGRMDAEEMQNFFNEHNPKIVVDATHPYADKVTENIKKACGCRYISVTREDDKTDFGISFDDIKSAVEFLKTTEGEILITTGSKEISAFSVLSKRAYARVLPTEESVKLCLDAGFKSERIISAKPPFSKEENAAIIREKNIKYLVTKRTGKSGGFMEKVEAARENGAECIIINRPTEETGLTVEETQREILKLI